MKIYPKTIITRAKQLRSTGSTYREIYDELGANIPKSTLNGWVRHITPPDSYLTQLRTLNQLHLSQIRPLAQAKNREKLDCRLNFIRNKNTDLVKSIDKSCAKLILATLYWCEGAKYPSHSNLQFGNSDPGMIKIFLLLLRSCYILDESKFRMSVQCRADQNQKELIKFWGEITGINISQHYATKVDQRSIGKPTLKTTYKGVCVIHYFDTDLQCELQFLGEYLGKDIALKQMKKQLK